MKSVKSLNLFKFILVLFFIVWPSIQRVPEVEISNGIIKAGIYLPDINNGYYQATRFDWSGIISKLDYGGHTFIGRWFKKYDPKIHDAILGPVDSFEPLYENISDKEKNEFTKIGVGTLIDSSGDAYSPFKYYNILDPGKWSVTTKYNEVKFKHKLLSGKYPYEYEKIIRIVDGKPQLKIIHVLKNIGDMAIKTEVYNHNFFMIDNQKTGPEISFEFPFNVETLENGKKGFGDVAEVEGKKIIFLRKPIGDEYVYSHLEGFGSTSKDYNVIVKNHKTGAGIRIQCNYPISRLVFWASSTISCAEPYTDILIEPGDVFEWTISYDFFVQDIR